MAELDGIEEILFFSYSSINNNTKKKINRICKHKNKENIFL